MPLLEYVVETVVSHACPGFNLHRKRDVEYKIMEANLKTAEQSYKALRLHLSLNMNLTIQQNHELLAIPEKEEEWDLRPSSSVPTTSPSSSIPYKINPSDMKSFIK